MKRKTRIREYKGKSLVDFLDDYVCVDIETNGLFSGESEIIEIGAIKIHNGKEVDRFSHLIKNEYPLSPFITNLTGITNKMLENQKGIEDVLPLFLDFLGDSVVLGHNVNFDVNFLYDSCMKVLDIPLQNDFVDTLRLSRRILPNLINHKLGTLCMHYNISHINAHRAIGDCEATVMLYNNLKRTQLEYEQNV